MLRAVATPPVAFFPRDTMLRVRAGNLIPRSGAETGVPEARNAHSYHYLQTGVVRAGTLLRMSVAILA